MSKIHAISLCPELLSKQKHLIIRTQLEEIRISIINEISKADKGSIFYYDFTGVGAINSSGIDEIIEKIIEYLINYEQDKFLYLANLQEEFEHLYNIDKSLSSGNNVTVAKVNNAPYFIGKISTTHKNILNLVYEYKRISARDLADMLGKQLTLISTHLNTLYKKKLIMRNEENLFDGGRQYIYRSLF